MSQMPAGEDVTVKMKIKRTAKRQQAENPTRCIVKEMLGAQLESREAYVDLKRKRIELEELRQERKAEIDQGFMCFMGQIGQMMSNVFAQSVGR